MIFPRHPRTFTHYNCHAALAIKFLIYVTNRKNEQLSQNMYYFCKQIYCYIIDCLSHYLLISLIRTIYQTRLENRPDLLAPTPVKLKYAKTFISFYISRTTHLISIFVSMTRKSFTTRRGIGVIWEKSVPRGVGCRWRCRDGGEHKIHRVT